MSRARILADYVSSGDELALKAPLASPAFTGTPTGITGTHITSGTLGNTVQDNITRLGTVTVGDISHADIVYPAGHIIGSNKGHYEWVGDVEVDDTSEAFGVTLPLTLKKANAKVYASYNVDGVLHNGENLWFNVAYKSSSFSSGSGNDSHGGADLNQLGAGSNGAGQYFRTVTYNQYAAYHIHQWNSHALGNSAGDTYYFAPVAKSGSGNMQVNNAGAYGSLTFMIWEIG